MSWDWQQAVSLAIVAAAAAGLVWGKLRRRKFSFQRDTHCGCSSPSTGTRQTIIFRARKGERREVVVKI
jgi:hypothetical protein